MNPLITPARRVRFIKSDSTVPQYLHLPINAPCREKVSPLARVMTFVVSAAITVLLLCFLFI